MQDGNGREENMIDEGLALKTVHRLSYLKAAAWTGRAEDLPMFQRVFGVNLRTEERGGLLCLAHETGGQPDYAIDGLSIEGVSVEIAHTYFEIRDRRPRHVLTYFYEPGVIFVIDQANKVSMHSKQDFEFSYAYASQRIEL